MVMRHKHSASRAGHSSELNYVDDENDSQVGKMDVIQEKISGVDANNTFITGTDDMHQPYDYNQTGTGLISVQKHPLLPLKLSEKSKENVGSEQEDMVEIDAEQLQAMALY